MHVHTAVIRWLSQGWLVTVCSWAIDLGSGSYALRGYWTKSSKDGARYSYYRKSTRGHNTLTFGGWDGHPGPSNQLGECSNRLVDAVRTLMYSVRSVG